MTLSRLDHPPRARLTLDEVPGGYTVTDQTGHPWTLTPVDLDQAIQFMRAAQAKRHAQLDEDSIEWFRCLRQFGESTHSVDANLAPVIPLRRKDIA